MDYEDWAALYRSAVPKVYKALVATLRGREAAEDALHDAFLAGLRRPPSHEDNLEGWLFRVALRHARRRSRSYVPLRAAAQVVDEPTVKILDRLETGRLLNLLTARQRAIVVAHYYLGLTHEEAARAFGIRTGTISATLAQALVRMRKERARA